MPKTHELKTWPSFYEAILRGEKTFEARRNDRDFAVGDKLQLREFDPGKDCCTAAFKYTGRMMTCEVTYILHGGQWGVESGFCIMAFKRLS